LSREEVRRAVNIAQGDERVAEFVGRHGPEIVEVRKQGGDQLREGGCGRACYPSAVVTVGFEEPVPSTVDRYPLGACDIGGHSGNVTGVVWVVDLEEGGISAVSPQWDYEVACSG